MFARVLVGAHLYAPIGLPSEYAVVRTSDRSIQKLGEDTLETRTSAQARHAAQESVWNVVWRRRVIYFLTVFASLYLVIYPLVRESYAQEEMATRLRVILTRCNFLRRSCLRAPPAGSTATQEDLRGSYFG